MGKVKKKRMSFVVDMTPLVDITFLLLTFLMFTATFKADTEGAKDQITVTRPTAAADTTFLPEKDLAIVTVGLDKKDTVVTFGISSKITREQVRELIPELPESFIQDAVVRVADSAMLVNLLRTTASVSEKTVYAIDGDKSLFFHKIQDVMEIFRVARVRTFNYVTDKKRSE